MAQPRDNETITDTAIRHADHRETTMRATAAAFAFAEVLALVRQALTKRSNRQIRRGRARGDQ